MIWTGRAPRSARSVLSSATDQTGHHASFGYDDLGRRTTLTRGNGATTLYGYDGASRLATLTQYFNGAQGTAFGFTYNKASQIATRTSSNDAYAYTGQATINRVTTNNVLNQATSTTAGGITMPLTHDARGNLTNAGGGATWAYNAKNQLWQSTGPVATTLYYDPIGRLSQIWASGTSFVYVGAELVAETGGVYDLARRYVHGPGTDEPILWYEGTGTADKRYLHADERGSIVALSNAARQILKSYTPGLAITTLRSRSLGVDAEAPRLARSGHHRRPASYRMAMNEFGNRPPTALSSKRSGIFSAGSTDVRGLPDTLMVLLMVLAKCTAKTCCILDAYVLGSVLFRAPFILEKWLNCRAAVSGEPDHLRANSSPNRLRSAMNG